MKSKACVLLFLPRLGFFVVMIFMGGIFLPTVAEAVVTIRSATGTIEVLLQEEQTWKPLGETKTLRAGDQIMTGPGASVDLILEDGSELNLGEETQLALSELDFSMAEKKRVSRLKLFWGRLTAKAEKLDFEENVFDVETDTVVAGFKFSSATIIAEEPKSVGAQPTVKIIPLEGSFEIRQTDVGSTTVECLLDDTLAGISFLLDSVDGIVEVYINPTEGKISLKSNVPLRKMPAILTEAYNTLHIDNALEAFELRVIFRENTVIVGLDSSVLLGIAPDKTNQELQLENEAVDAVFWFGQRNKIPGDGFYVYAERGAIEVNGQVLKPGTSRSFPIEVPEEEEPEAREEDIEEPVAPPSSPQRPSNSGTGSPVTPPSPPEEEPGSPVEKE